MGGYQTQAKEKILAIKNVVTTRYETKGGKYELLYLSQGNQGVW